MLKKERKQLRPSGPSSSGKRSWEKNQKLKTGRREIALKERRGVTDGAGKLDLPKSGEKLLMRMNWRESMERDGKREDRRR
jgi:hypothetical protein